MRLSTRASTNMRSLSRLRYLRGVSRRFSAAPSATTARSARRAERALVGLGKAETLRDGPRQYLNRLSDLMFVLARVLNRMNGGDDVYWKSERLARDAGETDAADAA